MKVKWNENKKFNGDIKKRIVKMKYGQENKNMMRNEIENDGSWILRINNKKVRKRKEGRGKKLKNNKKECREKWWIGE